MENRTIKLYKFEELSEIMQRDVLGRYYDIDLDWEWWSDCYKEIKNIANLIGIELKGNYPQGHDLVSTRKGYLSLDCTYKYNKSKDRMTDLNNNSYKSRFLRQWNKQERSIQAKYSRRLSFTVDSTKDKRNISCFLDNEAVSDLSMYIMVSQLFDLFYDYSLDMIKNEYEYLTCNEHLISVFKDYCFTETGNIFFN